MFLIEHGQVISQYQPQTHTVGQEQAGMLPLSINTHTARQAALESEIQKDS